MPLGKKKKGHLRNVLKTNSQLFSFSVQFCILALHLVLQWGECLLKKWSRHTCLICTSLCSWMIGPNRPSELFRKQHSAMCALPWLGELLLLFSRQVMSDSPWPHDSEFQASGSLTISQSLPKFMYTECRGLHNSVKLWVMPCKATQDWQVRVESSDKTWSTWGENGKPLQYTCCENPMNCIKKRQKSS